MKPAQIAIGAVAAIAIAGLAYQAGRSQAPAVVANGAAVPASAPAPEASAVLASAAAAASVPLVAESSASVPAINPAASTPAPQAAAKAPSKPAPRPAPKPANPAPTPAPQEHSHVAKADPEGIEAQHQKPVEPAPPKLCAECATVVQIRSEQREGKGSGLGAVGGAVLGGLLGNQIGGGNGKTLATVAGAAAGGLAGNSIEKSRNARQVWVVRVSYQDGRTRSFEYEHQPDLRVDMVVRERDGVLERY